MAPIDCLATIAVHARQFLGMFGHVGEQRLQVLHVEQRQSVLVGNLEGDVEHAFLGIAQIHQPRQEQRSHLGQRRANPVALFAEQVPEDHRELLELIEVQADRRGALLKEILVFAYGGNAGKVAFHVGAEHRHAGIGKTLRQDLQRHRLAGADRASDQPVPVGIAEIQIFALVDGIVRIAAGTDIEFAVLKHVAVLPFLFPLHL